ncbi:putative transferase [Rosa chinensis]|uniref:Putative transferase n=1 Tax=Rosa chinensis TaxID=74649 RepID=A0A2P6RB28_ROSCH|nr:putative transferase [Rosa chinensis]
MTSMTSLSRLNLSYNNLSGPIPSANQFQTFNDPSIFEANLGLCRNPLPIQCSAFDDGDAQAKESTVEDEDGYENLWFYTSTTFGFIVGFWVVFGSLVIKRSWRHANFQYLDKMKNRCAMVFNLDMA